jgi:hypothetical protein
MLICRLACSWTKRPRGSRRSQKPRPPTITSAWLLRFSQRASVSSTFHRRFIDRRTSYAERLDQLMLVHAVAEPLALPDSARSRAALAVGHSTQPKNPIRPRERRSDPRRGIRRQLLSCAWSRFFFTGPARPGAPHLPPPALPAQGGSVPAAPATVRTNPNVLVTASAIACGTNRPGSVAWIAVSSSASLSPIRRLERSAVSSRNRFR